MPQPTRPTVTDSAAESELSSAEHIARVAHAGQFEQSTGDPYIRHPYIRHVERVVELVSSHGPDAMAVAWLHDVLEDTGVQPTDLATAGISQTLITAVLVLSRFEFLETYAEHIDRVRNTRNSPQIVRAVKVADLRDHLRPGGNCPASLRPRYEAAWRVLCPGEPLPDANAKSNLLPSSSPSSS